MLPWTALFNLCIKYVGHMCNYPGCQSVIVVDGNMKNRRDICAATEAGYVEYSGLPGKIKSGCQLTPMQTSKYCYQHAERVCKPTPASLQEDEEQGRASSNRKMLSEEGIVKMILSKKQTRSGVYYQVFNLPA